MLVLTRKLQQQIKIGDHVTVTILRVKGQTVRVGIEAPREVRVIRGELPREGATDAEETTIIEARLTLTDEAAPGSSDTQDDCELPRDESAGGLPARHEVGRICNPSAAPCSPLPLRLPQRKRFSRTDTPPLRVAHLPAPTLAK